MLEYHPKSGNQWLNWIFKNFLSCLEQQQKSCARRDPTLIFSSLYLLDTMQQYCIKWNNHGKNFQSTLPKVRGELNVLRVTEIYVYLFFSISKIRSSLTAIFLLKDSIWSRAINSSWTHAAITLPASLRTKSSMTRTSLFACRRRSSCGKSRRCCSSCITEKFASRKKDSPAW